MLVNTEISGATIREDFGTRLAALAAYIEHPSTNPEPLFHDDELDIVNTLLAGDATTDGLVQLKDLVEKRLAVKVQAEDITRGWGEVTA
jgi:hypothetical protein